MRSTSRRGELDPSRTRLIECTKNMVKGPISFTYPSPCSHRTGPVVRITPDEVHVQEQLYHTSHADGWIKGTERLDSGRNVPGKASQRFQSKKRSISRARSILQVEVHQVLRGMVQRHQLHRVFGALFPLFSPLLGGHETRSDPEESDLEEGQHRVDRMIGPVRPNQTAERALTA